jgi:predicted nuclease of predicted toxin-antitoxin system
VSDGHVRLKLLLDENLSPRVAVALRALGIDAVHVRDRSMFGATDPEVLRRALAEDRIVVTSNVSDFVRLAHSIELHAGVVLIEDGDLVREEQEAVVERAATLIQAALDAGREMINRVMDIDRSGVAGFEDIPKPG